VPRETKEHPVHQVNVARLDHKDLLVKLDPKEPLVNLDRMDPEVLEDLPVPLELLDLPANVCCRPHGTLWCSWCTWTKGQPRRERLTWRARTEG